MNKQEKQELIEQENIKAAVKMRNTGILLIIIAIVTYVVFML